MDISGQTGQGGNVAAGEKLSEKGKALTIENDKLKEKIKELEGQLNGVQEELQKSSSMRERLDGLCKELQRQTQSIKDENHAMLKEAEERGKNIADHVATNVGTFDNITESIANVSKDNAAARQLNENLAGQVTQLKKEYDDREKILSEQYEEANKELMIAKREYAMERLHGAQAKETIYGEMQTMANALVDAKKDLKDTKEMEYKLRTQIDEFDSKFVDLQSSLVSTNSAYENFNGDMAKITKEAKGLEEEAVNWQKKWDETTKNLTEMSKKHTETQEELVKVHEKLITMTKLYKALQDGKTELLKKANREEIKQ